MGKTAILLGASAATTKSAKQVHFFSKTLLVMGALFLYMPPQQVRAASTDLTNRQEQNVNRLTPPKMAPLVTAELEDKIADYFAARQCNEITALIQPVYYPRLRPLLAAVVAYCSQTPTVAEELFTEAETKEPRSDIILVLHARYRWRTNPEAAKPIWQKVLQTSHNQATRQMATDYLQDNGDTETDISLGSLWTYYVNTQLGVSRESNPTATSISDPNFTGQGSNATNIGLSLGLQRNMDVGNLSLNYSLVNNRYASAHTGDFMANTLETPFAIRADSDADFILRPFFSYLTLGNQPYQVYGGLGVLGWVYRSDHNQSVQGSIYRDAYFPQEIKQQQGVHFRLEYNWEFYPPNVFFRVLTSFEHVTASADTDPDAQSTITYSHNDLSLQLFGEYNVRWATIGLTPRFYMRQDDLSSSYLPSGRFTGNPITKRRQDYQLILTPSLTVPLSKQIQLYSWYEISRIFSNIGPSDYADRNVLNQTIGIAVRALVSHF